jgi:hypothetical protein
VVIPIKPSEVAPFGADHFFQPELPLAVSLKVVILLVDPSRWKILGDTMMMSTIMSKIHARSSSTIVVFVGSIDHLK